MIPPLFKLTNLNRSRKEQDTSKRNVSDPGKQYIGRSNPRSSMSKMKSKISQNKELKSEIKSKDNIAKLQISDYTKVIENIHNVDFDRH